MSISLLRKENRKKKNISTSIVIKLFVTDKKGKRALPYNSNIKVRRQNDRFSLDCFGCFAAKLNTIGQQEQRSSLDTKKNEKYSRKTFAQRLHKQFLQQEGANSCRLYKRFLNLLQNPKMDY